MEEAVQVLVTKMQEEAKRGGGEEVGGDGVGVIREHTLEALKNQLRERATAHVARELEVFYARMAPENMGRAREVAAAYSDDVDLLNGSLLVKYQVCIAHDALALERAQARAVHLVQQQLLQTQQEDTADLDKIRIPQQQHAQTSKEHDTLAAAAAQQEWVQQRGDMEEQQRAHDDALALERTQQGEQLLGQLQDLEQQREAHEAQHQLLLRHFELIATLESQHQPLLSRQHQHQPLQPLAPKERLALIPEDSSSNVQNARERARARDSTRAREKERGSARERETGRGGEVGAGGHIYIHVHVCMYMHKCMHV